MSSGLQNILYIEYPEYKLNSLQLKHFKVQFQQTIKLDALHIIVKMNKYQGEN